VSTPSRRVSSETPVQVVSSFDHLVTQWIVDVHRLRRSARKLVPSPSSAPRRPPRGSEKLHVSSGACGVGPAESTGKSSVTYCPGGTRAGFDVGPAPAVESARKGHRTAADVVNTSMTFEATSASAV